MTRTGYRAPACRQCGAPRHEAKPKRAACKECLNREARERRAKKRDENPAAWAEKKRNEHLKYTFGMAPEDYARMLAEQDGRCAICETLSPGGHGRLTIDHDHVTGEVRQLLCTNCNSALGLAQDDPQLLRKMATYVERHAGRTEVI